MTSRRASPPTSGGATDPRTGPALLPRWLPPAVLAAVIYLPLLLTQPGRVGADTKTYLYLDPGRLLSDASYLWDPGVGLGTVTHQNIGYLWPAGPFYWAFEALSVPDWIAQRLWLGTIMLAAGLGVLYLLRTLSWQPSRTGAVRVTGGTAVAAFAYALSPYVLDYAARISVILLPWAALPWLIAFLARSLRSQGWRHPALFALTVLTVGAINATSVFLVGLGPLLWLIWAVAVERSASWARAGRAVLRVGVLTAGVSLWWIAGLAIQGRYSVPIVRYTETYEAVAVASTTPEILRGLGYWFFYGNDKLGQWIIPSINYMSYGLVLSYLLPGLALVSAALVRFRRRGFFVALIVVGVLVGVGGHPYDDPSPAGSILVELTKSDLGLAFRSTARAVPLVVLGTAVLLGAGLDAVSARYPRRAAAVTALAALLVVANLPALFVGQMVDRNLRRDEDLPDYWTEAAAVVDDRGDDTRVLELPGTDFAAYRWGNTVDPVTPGLIDRPYVARELIPLGSPASANLVNAVDRPLQEGTFDPDTLAPLARLLSAGDILLRSDLEYERFRTPRPEATWDLLTAVPGLDDPTGFGPAEENRPRPSLPLMDEVELATDPDLEDPPPVAVFPVEDPLPIIRTVPSEAPTVLAGDGDGVVAATAAGVVDPERALLYSADLLTQPELTDRVLADGADLVITDSNRRRARRGGAIRENEGFTEAAGETPLRDDVSDNRLDLFAGADDDSFTVSIQEGDASAQATAYGNPVTFTPGDRAYFAMDGDFTTAWRVGAFSEVTGERLRITADEPVTTDRVTVTQAPGTNVNRWITDVELRFDGGDPTPVRLGRASRRPPGQVVEFGERTFSRLEIEITGDTVGFRPKLAGISAVGFAEVDLEGIVLDEVIRPPIDLIDHLGPDSIEHRLTYVLQRLRNNPQEPVRSDEEPSLRRRLDPGADRAFTVTGEARLSPTASDELLDDLVGLAPASAGGSSARASSSLEGDLLTRPRSAFDRDPDTAWSTPLDTIGREWVEQSTGVARTVDHLRLDVVADQRHSLPTRIQLVVDGEAGPILDVPRLDPGADVGAVRSATIDVPPVSGSTFRLRIVEIDPRTTVDWYSGSLVALPVALAEVEFGEPPPAAQQVMGSAPLTRACRDDLLTMDGMPVPVRLDGTVGDALARRPLRVSGCEELEIAAGPRTLASTAGERSGIDIDRIVLSSDRDGVPTPPGVSPIGAEAPAAVTTDRGRLTHDVTIDPSDEPYWLVLGQSRNDGWEADAQGASLSDPVIISGYGNGWYVDPGTGPTEVRLDWTPQRAVWWTMGLSLVAVLVCLALVVRGGGGRRGGGPVDEAPRPRLRWESDPGSDLAPVGWRAATIAALGTLAVGLSFAPPAVALVAGLGAWAAFGLTRGALAVRLAAVGLYGAIVAWILLRQWQERFPADFAWPKQFESAHWPMMAVVLLLAVDASLAAVRARRAAPPGSSEAPEGQGGER